MNSTEVSVELISSVLNVMFRHNDNEVSAVTHDDRLEKSNNYRSWEGWQNY